MCRNQYTKKMHAFKRSKVKSMAKIESVCRKSENPLVMGLFLKFKPKKDENQKALKKNYTLSNLIPWETGSKVKMLGCNVTGPSAELYFSLNG